MNKDQVKELNTKLGLSYIQKLSHVDVCMHICAYMCACAYYTVKRKQKIQAEECISNILVLEDKNFKIIMIVVFKHRKRQTK